MENSPTYHLMVARSLNQHVILLNRLQHRSEPVLRRLLSKAGKYAAHVVMPNGHFPPISDSNKGPIAVSSAAFLGDEFEYSASGGKKGTKPLECSIVFPESGYAIYRSDWNSKDSTYVLMQAAYNNNYHKHSDDLSLIIYGKGKEIITEPGPYSYNYKDPFSRYAYSQFAHNTIVVDNKSVPRTDDK
ncbi:heparinase II/III domain-containing protein, partial [Glutamicibacter arilaitensis]|uniref:heparinase II/III domain-containing protein n=1 Tax=Glutamicibacter arilaitensis TaxID=256701 RepID=UPI003FD27D28